MAEQKVAAVERALRILDCFGVDKQKLSLKEIAERTGLYKSTILRLASSLSANGYLTRLDDGNFALGPTLWRLGSLYRSRFNFSDVVRPVLRLLSEATSESASIYVRDGDTRVCLFRQNGPQAIRHHLDEGIHLTLEQGAPGHLIRAFTETDFSGAAKIIADGYAVSLGERDPDTASIAVPVKAADGRFIGALVISGLLTRFDADARDRAIGLAQQAAQQIGPKII